MLISQGHRLHSNVNTRGHRTGASFFLLLSSPRAGFRCGREAGKSYDQMMLLPQNLIRLKGSHAIDPVLLSPILTVLNLPSSFPSFLSSSTFLPSFLPSIFPFLVGHLKLLQIYFYTSIIIISSSGGMLTHIKYFIFCTSH